MFFFFIESRVKGCDGDRAYVFIYSSYIQMFVIAVVCVGFNIFFLWWLRHVSTLCSFRLLGCFLIKAGSTVITLERVPFSVSHESHMPAGDNNHTRVNI